MCLNGNGDARWVVVQTPALIHWWKISVRTLTGGLEPLLSMGRWYWELWSKWWLVRQCGNAGNLVYYLVHIRLAWTESLNMTYIIRRSLHCWISVHQICAVFGYTGGWANPVLTITGGMHSDMKVDKPMKKVMGEVSVSDLERNEATKPNLWVY